MLYHITSLGFVRQSFDAMVDGIVEVRAASEARQQQPLLLLPAAWKQHDGRHSGGERWLFV
jgi:hypothetical protein